MKGMLQPSSTSDLWITVSLLPYWVTYARIESQLARFVSTQHNKQSKE